MLTTVFLLGLVYVVGFAVLTQVLNLGLIPVVILAGVLLGVQYWTSDKIALRTAGAKIVTAEEAPELHASIQRLCITADLPMPRVALIDADMPNAFATGRTPNHAAVAVTTGLIKRLEPHELEGVIAHELSHVKNRDVGDHDDCQLLRHDGRDHRPLRLLLRRLRRRLRRRTRQRSRRQRGVPDGGHPRVGGGLRTLVRAHPNTLPLPRVRRRSRRRRAHQVPLQPGIGTGQDHRAP